MNSEIITIEILHKMTEQLIQAGYGDMKLKVGDNFVYEDDISRGYGKEPYFMIHDWIYSKDIIERTNKLASRIREAKEEFYMGGY